MKEHPDKISVAKGRIDVVGGKPVSMADQIVKDSILNQLTMATESHLVQLSPGSRPRNQGIHLASPKRAAVPQNQRRLAARLRFQWCLIGDLVLHSKGLLSQNISDRVSSLKKAVVITGLAHLNTAPLETLPTKEATGVDQEATKPPSPVKNTVANLDVPKTCTVTATGIITDAEHSFIVKSTGMKLMRLGRSSMEQFSHRTKILQRVADWRRCAMTAKHTKNIEDLTAVCHRIQQQLVRKSEKMQLGNEVSHSQSFSSRIVLCSSF